MLFLQKESEPPKDSSQDLQKVDYGWYGDPLPVYLYVTITVYISQ